jgi:hypothetical protein
MPPRKDLGSILVDEKVIGGKDLERVERERKDSGRPLWAALIDAQLISEDEVFFLLAQRYGAPVLADEEIEQAHMPEKLKRALARDFAHTVGLLPIDLAPDESRVTVVMVDPSDEGTLAAFLTRAQVPEGRAVLGRKAAIERAIDRCFGKAAVGKPPPVPAAIPRYHVDEVTGTVKIDPELAAEIARLPARATSLTPLSTPLPKKERPRKHTPVPVSVTAAQSPPTEEATHPGDDRLIRTLIQAVESLAHELELRLSAAGADDSGRLGRAGRAGEMARLARRVARQMGLQRRFADEIGVAAQLYTVDAMMRQVDGAAAADLFNEMGWPAAGEGGLVPILRALSAASAGFARQAQLGTPPLGARIISVVSDYLQLGAAAGEADLETVSQLLRASSAGAPVVDALLRVLEAERADRTPESQIQPAPATSLLKDAEEDPTGEVRDPDTIPKDELTDDNKTVRKPMPRARRDTQKE